MRLIIRLGYNNNFLFGKGANVSELISALDHVQQVTERGYGDEKKFVVSTEVQPELILVPDDSVSLPENHTEFLDRYHSKAAECDKLRSEIRTLENKIEDMKKGTGNV